MVDRYFAPRAARAPWGDYGLILIHGMSCHLPRENGLIQLERTGPFIPPMTIPGTGDVVLTQAFARFWNKHRSPVWGSGRSSRSISSSWTGSPGTAPPTSPSSIPRRESPRITSCHGLTLRMSPTPWASFGNSGPLIKVTWSGVRTGSRWSAQRPRL